MPLLKHNARIAVSDCQAHLSSWSRNPMRASQLSSAWRAIGPLLTQMLKSGYVGEDSLHSLRCAKTDHADIHVQPAHADACCVTISPSLVSTGPVSPRGPS